LGPSLSGLQKYYPEQSLELLGARNQVHLSVELLSQS